MCRTIVLCVVIAACGPADETPAPRTIADLGVTLDVPRSWGTHEEGKGAVRLGDKNGKELWLTAMMVDAEALDVLYDRVCKTASQPGTKETTAAGTLVAACTVSLTTKEGKPVEVKQGEAWTKGGKGWVRCRWGSSGSSHDVLAATCKSMRGS